MNPLADVLPMLSQGARSAKEVIKAINWCIQFEILQVDPRIEAIIVLTLNLGLPAANRRADYGETSLEDLRQEIGRYIG